MKSTYYYLLGYSEKHEGYDCHWFNCLWKPLDKMQLVSQWEEHWPGSLET